MPARLSIVNGEPRLMLGTRRLRLCKHRGCTSRPNGKAFYCAPHSPLKDPAWRQARSRRAGILSIAAHQQRVRKDVEQMEPVKAYAKGYRVGYVRAYHFWKRWAEQVTKRSA